MWLSRCGVSYYRDYSGGAISLRPVVALQNQYIYYPDLLPQEGRYNSASEVKCDQFL